MAYGFSFMCGKPKDKILILNDDEHFDTEVFFIYMCKRSATADSGSYNAVSYLGRLQQEINRKVYQTTFIHKIEPKIKEYFNDCPLVLRCPMCSCAEQEEAIHSAWAWLHAAQCGYGIPILAASVYEKEGWHLSILMPRCDASLDGCVYYTGGAQHSKSSSHTVTADKVLECIKRASSTGVVFLDIKPGNMCLWNDCVYFIDQDADYIMFLDLDENTKEVAELANMLLFSVHEFETTCDSSANMWPKFSEEINVLKKTLEKNDVYNDYFMFETEKFRNGFRELRKSEYLKDRIIERLVWYMNESWYKQPGDIAGIIAAESAIQLDKDKMLTNHKLDIVNLVKWHCIPVVAAKPL